MLLTSIFEPDNPEVSNETLTIIIKKCLEQIDTKEELIEKHNLEKLLKLVTNEFIKPISNDPQAYLFSSAVANYFLDTTGKEKEKIDGLIYPTCLGIDGIRNLGVNYVLRNDIIGFGKKIEFYDVYRSRMDKNGFDYFETTIRPEKIDKNTGEIFWPS